MAKINDKALTRKSRVVRSFNEKKNIIDPEQIEKQNRLMICAIFAFSTLWALANMSVVQRHTGIISLGYLIQNPLILIGTFSFCILIIGLFVGYANWAQELLELNVLKWSGLTFLLLLTPFCAALSETLVPDVGLPYIAVAILLSKFFKPSFIFFSMTLMMFCVGLFRDYNLGEMLGPLSAILCVALIRRAGAKRFEEITIGFLAALTLCFVDVIMQMRTSIQTDENIIHFIFSLGSNAGIYALYFLQGMLSAFVAILLTPLMEKVFDFVSKATLLELGDYNNELLRALLLRAPGTYNHSLIVATLAEEAANEIGANALACRVSAYYHDIGKMIKPDYFTENELGRNNKHGELSPSISALVITSHPKDGLELANEYKLPSIIKDAIMMHHGTSKIEYFYHKALEIKDENENIDESIFRYPGPRPNSKETGIIMLADVAEAATRSLGEPTPARIRTMIHSVFQKKIEDHQLDECPLTMRELHQIEEVFIRMTIAIFHSRIKYPGQEDNEKK